MKIIYKHTKAILIVLSLLVALGSCKKDEVVIGAPKGSKVTSISDQQVDITEGDMGDWIALHGLNQANPSQILFNDVEIDLDEIYYEDDVLFVQVPVKMPLVIDNSIKVKTKSGEAKYTFKVNIPPLELTTMRNEYTLPGDTITIYGNFLSLYEVSKTNTEVQFGDIKTPVIDVTDTYITARVPENVKANVKVKAINNLFKVTAEAKGFYQDKNNVITSFDTDFPYRGTTGKALIGPWTNPKPTSGNFLKLEASQTSHPNGLGWFYLIETSYTYKLDMLLNPQDYELKFELNMTSPMQKTRFFFYYVWSANPFAVGPEYINVQNLGKWQTVTVPLTMLLRPAHTGTAVNRSLNIRVENAAPTERTAMYFDNFRIYKKGS